MNEKNKTKNKTTIKKIISVLIYLIILFTILFYISRLVSPIGSKTVLWLTSNSQREIYKEPKDTIDVIFAGNSSVYASVNPIVIYKNTNIKSYDVSLPSATANDVYYLLRDVYKRQNPKIVFLEADMLFEKTKKQHKAFPIITPYFSSKIAYLMDKNSNVPEGEFLNSFFTIYGFHDRIYQLEMFDWSKMSRDILTEGEFKGSNVQAATHKFKRKNKEKYNKENKNNVTNINKNSAKNNKKEKQKEEKKEISINNERQESNINNIEITENTISSLNNIMNLCKKHGTKVILFKVHYPGIEQIEKQEKIVEELAKKYNIEYILLKDELNIDENKDYSDNGYHYNYNGMIKASNYFSKVLKTYNMRKQYDKSWNESVDTFYDFIAELDKQNIEN